MNRHEDKHRHEDMHHHDKRMVGHDHVITFLLSEIKYDVKFDTWLKAKVANRENKNSNPNAEKVGYSYNDDRAEDWLVRQIETAVDNIKGEINWAVVDVDRFVDDEILVNPHEWHLHLHFSPDWRGSISAIRSACHKYIGDYILGQWYRSAMPKESAQYIESAEYLLTKIYNEARSEVVRYKPWTL